MIVRPLGSRQKQRAVRHVRTSARSVGQEFRGNAPDMPMGVPAPIGMPPAGTFPFPMPPSVGHEGCPVFPSTMKYISAITGSLAMGAQATLSFTTPGAFCPLKMLVFGSVDTADVNIVSINSGLEEQVIAEPVPADIFSIANDCCPVACLKCMCTPGVPLNVTVENVDAMAQTVRVVLIGTYLDMCPPDGRFPDRRLPDVPGCPAPGSHKLLGFEVSVPMAGSATVSLTTPGRFCPEQLFLGATANDADLTVTSVESGLKDQIISGAIPGALFTTANECCVLQCFDCLCAPGVPLDLTFANADTMAAIVVRGVLVGSYTDLCP